ncbi:MAG: beta-lactamase family protein [Anaerolineae bacterium]|nr:beta-lactamase family protein [Anaerolineae bacterium]
MLTTELDAFIKPYVGKVFPAVALSVYLRGEQVVNRAWGWIAPESKAQPTTVEARFDFASLTKLFTTTALLSLLSQGAAGLDTPLVAIVPEFSATTPRGVDGGQDPHTRQLLPLAPERSGETVDPAQVTLFHLLTHTSGLAPWRAVYEAAGAAPEPPEQVNPAERGKRWARGLQAICRYPFVGQPGEAVRYSDLGFMLLGEVVSRLHGTPGDLEVAMNARVIEPLRLESLVFNPLQKDIALTDIVPTEVDALWRGRRVWGEVHDENACGVGGVAGHAGLFGTAQDVARFGQAWLTGSVPGVSPALLHAATREHAVTDGERRGLGWMLRSYQGSSAGDLFAADSFGHTGFVGNSLWIDPQEQLVVACMTNRVYYGRANDGIIAFRRSLHDWLWQRLCRPQS